MDDEHRKSVENGVILAEALCTASAPYAEDPAAIMSAASWLLVGAARCVGLPKEAFMELMEDSYDSEHIGAAVGAAHTVAQALFEGATEDESN